MSGNQSFTIDKVGWHTNTPGNPESVARIHVRFKVIIFFLQNNGLTTRTILAKDEPVTDDLTITSSDLTSDGLTLMKGCYDKWLQRLDQGVSPEDLTVFQKPLVTMHNNKRPRSKPE